MKSTMIETIAAGLCICLFYACGGGTGDGKHTVSGQVAAPASPPAPAEVDPGYITDPIEPALPATTVTTTAPVDTVPPATTTTVSPACTGPAPDPDPVVTGNPNVARSASVTLIGSGFFTGGWGSGKTVDAGTIVDGLFFPRNTQWDQGPVWWDSRDGVERSIMIELDGLYRIDSFIVQADDNDAYVLSYRDPSTGSWLTAWNVPNYDVVPASSNWGMQTRPKPGNNTERYVLPVHIVTDALRMTGDMNDSDRYFSVSEVQAFGVPLPSVPVPPSVPACVSPYPRLVAKNAGYGTPVIDGVMNASEWATAARFDLQANLPPYDGGGTTPASVYVMNDGINLYFALKVARVAFGGATNPTFIFDNNDDNCPAEGDDGFGMYVGTYSPPVLSDIYRYSCPGAPLNSVGCSAYDMEQTRGILPAGKTEGRTAATNDGMFTYIEMTHPLNSGDALHDIALKPGDPVGFHFSLRLFSLTSSCNYGWNCMADTEVPAVSSYNAYVRITTAAGAPY
jgi:hypothetical protein